MVDRIWNEDEELSRQAEQEQARFRASNNGQGHKASSRYNDFGADAHLHEPKPPINLDEELGIYTPTAERLKNVKPRPWLYSKYLIRKQVTMLSGISSGGKSTFAMMAAVEMAANRAILGHQLWRPNLRVWYAGLDDPQEEHDRRLRAILEHHHIDIDELGGRLKICGRSNKFVIANRSEKTGDLIITPILDALSNYLQSNKIDVIIIDPFIRTHLLEENSNSDMGPVMTLWSELAEQANCSVMLLHHIRKGATDAEDQHGARGAGAIVDLARSGIMLAKMSREEAQTFKIDQYRRGFFFRLGHAKTNMSAPAREAEWYQLVSVDIDDGDDEYPAGDSVQAVERWYPPALFTDLSPDELKAIFDELRQGPEPGEKFTLTKKGGSERWAGVVIMKHTKKSDDEARDILKKWRDESVIYEVEYENKHRNKKKGVELNEIKIAEMLNPLNPLVDC